ncbi:MAG: phosphoenolpyruvate carboxykinase, partial [Devosia sp.]|nr:phosphoenolpyruvate carboxykinase [Devosia sp.]
MAQRSDDQIHLELANRIGALARVRWDELPPTLVETALAEGEGRLAAGGALAVTTGVFTGRSVKDKFIVRDAATEHQVWWDNNQPMAPEQFETLLADMVAATAERTLHGQHLQAGAAERHQLRVSVFTETAWHALFIRNLLIRPETVGSTTDVTILHLPSFAADPARHGS